MRKRTIMPIAFAATMLFGCASSNETLDDTTAMDETTMSETQSMAGSTSDEEAVETLVVKEEVVVPIATLSVTTLPMENTEDVRDMFDDIEDTEQFDIMALARKSPNLSTFVKLMEQANLVGDLERVGELTLFAPTNEAFAKVDKAKLEALLAPENKALLMKVLQAHVLPSKVSSTQFNTSQRIQMSEDSYIPVDVSMSGTRVTVGGATIVKDNIEASNGMIHVIDNVILPGEAAVEDAVGN